LAGRRLLAAFAALAIGVAGSGAAFADSILFVGNSFTFGARSAVWKYRADTVSDLNGTGYGGVPALFKLFTKETGLDYAVSEETVGGMDLRFHLDNKRALIDRPWDHVVLQSFSTLDAAHPGDPASLIATTPALARLFHARNPAVDIWLMATWSRADQTYPAGGHWHGKPITQMADDIELAYEQAATAADARAFDQWFRGDKVASRRLAGVSGVVAVGKAWNRAIAKGLATANPYAGVGPNQIDLWAWDAYHASIYGYYLEALMVFGAVTGKDPRTLGEREEAAAELGISPAQATDLQSIAYDELASPGEPLSPGGRYVKPR